MKSVFLFFALAFLTLTLKSQTCGFYEKNSNPPIYEQALGAIVPDNSSPAIASPFIEKYGLGDNQFGGILPKDMELIPLLNKLFISGSSGFRVLNTLTNTLEHKVEITQSGRYVNYDKLFMPNRRIASCMNTQANRNEVFWMNERGDIYIYDANTYNSLQVLMQPSSFPGNYFGNQIIYNSYTNELYRMENTIGTGTAQGTYIGIYKYNPSSGYYETSTQTDIYIPSAVMDIAFNETRSRFYLATQDGVEIYSATYPYSYINKVASASSMGNIEYVYNPTFNKHEVFCTPRDPGINNHKAIIIDGNNDFSYQTFMLPNTNYFGTEYNPLRIHPTNPVFYPFRRAVSFAA